MSEDQTIIGNFNMLSSAGDTSVKNKKSCLVQYNGDQLGKRFSMEQSVNIAGRSPETSIFIDESSVSRRHAKIFIGSDHATIEDLGSSNGTFVNNAPIKAARILKDGDMIRLGAILFKYFSSTNIDNLVHDKIYRMVTMDPGTGVFNRRYLQDTLKSEFKISRVYNQDISVIYYDLDFFKKVNDTYGHKAGDQILKESAQLIRNIIRRQDMLCRLGGEEFVIILPSTHIHIATELAERIRKTMEKHVFVLEIAKSDGTAQKVEHQQTLSLGVASLVPTMEDPKSLLEIADERLYQSKSSGRNKVTAA